MVGLDRYENRKNLPNLCSAGDEFIAFMVLAANFGFLWFG